jgi:hypothetical protein
MEKNNKEKKVFRVCLENIFTFSILLPSSRVPFVDAILVILISKEAEEVVNN